MVVNGRLKVHAQWQDMCGDCACVEQEQQKLLHECMHA